MRYFAPILAVLLFCNWVAVVTAFRLGVNPFPDFKIELPAVTLLAIFVTTTILFWPATVFVLLSSVFLALRMRIGWWLGLGVCLLCDGLVLSYVLPMITLINGLEGGDEVASLPTFAPVLFIAPISPTSAVPVIMLASFGLTQFIFAALIFRRPDLIKEGH